MKRKRLSTQSQIDGAIRQIIGAARYLQQEATALLVVGGKDVEISLGQRRVIGLAIVKELFDDEGEAYAAACEKLSSLSGGGIVMDYNSFHSFTHRFNTHDEFVRTLERLIEWVSANGWIKIKDVVFDGVLDWVEERRATPTS